LKQLIQKEKELEEAKELQQNKVETLEQAIEEMRNASRKQKKALLPWSG